MTKTTEKKEAQFPPRFKERGLHCEDLMIAIITCAGKGTRRRPETNFTPKILLDYQGDPLIEHIARPIDASDCFEQLVFVLNPRTGHQIIAYLRRNPLNTPVKFVWQDKPLGFGHAVLQAKSEVLKIGRWEGWKKRAPFLPLPSFHSPPVLIATDDGVRNPAAPNTPSFDLIRQMTRNATSTLGVKWVGNVRKHSLVIAEGVDRGGEKPDHLPRSNSPRPGQVYRVIEKPYWDEGGLALTGLYYIRESRRLFRNLNKLVRTGRCLGGEFQFTHALQMMVDQGTEMQTLYHEWIDAGSK